MDMQPAAPSQPPRRSRIILLVLLAGLGVLLAGLFAGMLLWQERTKPTVSQPQPVSQPVPPHTPLIRSSLVATGMKAPTGIVGIPGESGKQLFVLEQAGIVRILSTTGALEQTPFLDISNKVTYTGEMGLLGLAFHPGYAKNGYFYVNYIDKNQNTVIARYKAAADGKTADPASEKILFTLRQPYSNHNGGDLAFGPDGYLYITLGDGGSAGDPQNRAQDRASYFGKILRIDVNAGDPYTVPATNPFIKEDGTKAEIWALGLRNPWRISFDRTTGDLYIADVGQGLYEEIDMQKAGSKGGENYGWRCREGLHEFNTKAGCPSTYTEPVLEYGHDKGRCSVTGGYVYRGSQYAALKGKYFYGDYCSGELFYATHSGGKYTSVQAAKTPYMISAFGQGSDGELYFADYKTGSVYHIEDAAND